MGRLEHLITLYLDSNRLSGAIPAIIGNLHKLDGVDLSFNQLSGAIPAEIGNLKRLYVLDLNNNQLSGTIPASLRRLKSLSNLDLSHNRLSQDQNVHFSVNAQYVSGHINNNLFTFNGLEFIAKKYPKINYTPQANITIHQHSNTLSVYAGGTLSNNTYSWHQTGETNATTITGDSTFTPSQSGKYYVSVTNKVATKLTLFSDTINFTLSPLKPGSSILVAKSIQPATGIKHMQVYPNPAKNVVHIQVKGTAMIAIANADGKVMLTKTINNSDAINVSSLAPGTYYLQNKTTGETQKIVVMH